MRETPIAEGHRAIELAQIDRHVILNTPTQEDITQLEAIAIAHENPELVFATVMQPLAETSWSEPIGNDPDLFAPIWNACWNVILTDHFTIIFKEDSANVYHFQENTHSPMDGNPIDHKEGTNYAQIRRGLDWSEKTRQPSAAAGLTLSGWIASRIREAMHA